MRILPLSAASHRGNGGKKKKKPSMKREGPEAIQFTAKRKPGD